MKLIELINTVEIDDHVVQDAIDNIVDSVLVAELKEYRERRIDDYLSVKDGVPRNVYVFADLEQDAFEISRRIEAIDMILSDYTVGHEPYDFDDAPWWDADEEEGAN